MGVKKNYRGFKQTLYGWKEKLYRVERKIICCGRQPYMPPQIFVNLDFWNLDLGNQILEFRFWNLDFWNLDFGIQIFQFKF